MERRKDAIAIAALVLGVLALYVPPALLAPGHSLLGIDFFTIHDRRIQFVQEYFGAHGAKLPGWYPRELMGTPFWSNIQSFPFLPTRLALLWIEHDLVFPVAVNLAAVLSAIFTFLFLRRLSLGRLAAAVGGWTFAASGFFASRVMAGHLPLLEAYGSLPLLLWLVERLAQSDPDVASRWKHYLALALASLCVVLAGHPQIPAYAMCAAAIYALVRGPGRARATAFAAMATGVGLAGFVAWPMLRLIGRSTRILPLDAPGNDLAFPYWRLKAFLLPWADGWPSYVPRTPAKPFVESDAAVFWDTVCYVGWLPWIAAAFLLERAIRRRTPPDKRWILVAAIGAGALLLALPFAQEWTSGLRVTLLRSPARLVYLTTFALSAGTAALVDVVARARIRGSGLGGLACAALVLVAHAVDLGRQSRTFVAVAIRPGPPPSEYESWLRSVGDQRWAIDYRYYTPANRRVDDVGFFDSIMLARPYRAFMALVGASPNLNVQDMNGSELPAAALAGLCVDYVVTSKPRPDLRFDERMNSTVVYRVPDPAARAGFVPDEAVTFLEDDLVLVRFSQGLVELEDRMFLAPSSGTPTPPGTGGAGPARVEYVREGPDEILVRVENGVPGYARVIESFDEGWSATLDGAPAEILVADTFAMAVRLPPGRHELRFSYGTPGARTGLWISAASAALAILLVLRFRTAARRPAT